MSDTISREEARLNYQKAERKRRRIAIMRHVILIAWALIIMFPIYWMIQTSFKDAGEWVTWPPNWIPQDPTLKNYQQIFASNVQETGIARDATEQPFNIWGALRDSAIICTVSALIALLMGTFLAYSISRFNVGGDRFRHSVLIIRMIPPIVIALPLLMYYAIMTVASSRFTNQLSGSIALNLSGACSSSSSCLSQRLRKVFRSSYCLSSRSRGQ